MTATRYSESAQLRAIRRRPWRGRLPTAALLPPAPLMAPLTRLPPRPTAPLTASPTSLAPTRLAGLLARLAGPRTEPAPDAPDVPTLPALEPRKTRAARLRQMVSGENALRDTDLECTDRANAPGS